MIHTIYLDDKYVNARELLQKMYQQKQGVHFENPDNFAQEKYMTNKEFWKEADKRIIKICERYGVV